MTNRLGVLEEKITEVAALCDRLNADNLRLRQELLIAQAARDDALGRMAIAREQIEWLAEALPVSVPELTGAIHVE